MKTGKRIEPCSTPFTLVVYIYGSFARKTTSTLWLCLRVENVFLASLPTIYLFISLQRNRLCYCLWYAWSHLSDIKHEGVKDTTNGFIFQFSVRRYRKYLSLVVSVCSERMYRLFLPSRLLLLSNDKNRAILWDCKQLTVCFLLFIPALLWVGHFTKYSFAYLNLAAKADLVVPLLFVYGNFRLFLTLTQATTVGTLLSEGCYWLLEPWVGWWHVAEHCQL
jgi:hypothetical protein